MNKMRKERDLIFEGGDMSGNINQGVAPQERRTLEDSIDDDDPAYWQAALNEYLSPGAREN